MRIAVEIDEDIDARSVQQQGRIAVGQRRDIDEVLGLGYYTPAIRTAVVGAVRDREDLEGRAIMDAEQAAEEMRHGVVAEVGRDIGYPQALAALAPVGEIQPLPVACRQ